MVLNVAFDRMQSQNAKTAEGKVNNMFLVSYLINNNL